jgi:hypothetical protein
MIRHRLLSATLVIGALLALASSQGLPGQWSVPAPLFGQGFEWAPAPEGGTGTPLPGGLGTLPNVLALRLEVPGNVVDLGAVSLPIDYGFAGVQMPAGITVDEVTQLSYDTFYQSGLSCGGGSPRFQLAVDLNDNGTFEPQPGGPDGNIFVYAGAVPPFTGCPSGVWIHNDPIAEGGLRWDTTQLGTGIFYDSRAGAIAAAGAHNVLSVGVAWDSWWMQPGRSIVWVDNIRVNDFLLGEPVYSHACSLLAGQGEPVCA